MKGTSTSSVPGFPVAELVEATTLNFEFWALNFKNDYIVAHNLTTI